MNICVGVPSPTVSCVFGVDNPQCLCQRVAAQCPQIAARSLIYTQNEIVQAKDADRDTDTDADMDMTQKETKKESERGGGELGHKLSL